MKYISWRAEGRSQGSLKLLILRRLVQRIILLAITARAPLVPPATRRLLAWGRFEASRSISKPQSWAADNRTGRMPAKTIGQAALGRDPAEKADQKTRSLPSYQAPETGRWQSAGSELLKSELMRPRGMILKRKRSAARRARPG
jgi:hypothetical protein